MGNPSIILNGSTTQSYYDAESSLGLVPNDAGVTARQENQGSLTDALQASHYNGAYEFQAGHTGPVLYPIVFSAKQFYFEGPIKTSEKIGGNIKGASGSSGYHELEESYSSGAGNGGAVTRFTRTDAVNCDAVGESGVLHLRGAGWGVDGIQFWGARFNGSFIKGVTPVCNAGIIMEGNDAPTGLTATGKHRITNCLFGLSRYGILFPNGYYDATNTLQPKASGKGVHADESYFCNNTFGMVDVAAFRSDNEQAVCHTIVHTTIGGNSAWEPIVFDQERGGSWNIFGVILNHGKVTLQRMKYYASGACGNEISGVKWDMLLEDNKYLTLLKVDTDPAWASYGTMMPIRNRVSGAAGVWFDEPAPYRILKQKLFQIQNTIPGINLTDCLYDIDNLPTGKFFTTAYNSWVQSGRWWSPSNSSQWIYTP